MLSKDTQTRMIDALTSQNFGQLWINAVLARTAVTPQTLIRIQEAVTLVSAGNEIAAKMISGAQLSLDTSKRILIALASESAGNELINQIQSVPNAKPIVL